MMMWLLITSTLLGTAAAGSWIRGPDGPVVGVVGHDLRLPCHVKSGENAVDEEIIWKRGDQMVHHYLRHTDRTEHQPPEYRGRTNVSRVALQTGDVSLILTNLRLSDAGTYRCRVRADTWYDDAPVTAKVEAVGSTPSVTAVSLGDARVRLQCVSTGWSTNPQLQWLDSRGQQLHGEFTTSGDPTALLKLLGDSNLAPKQQVEPTASHNSPPGLQVTSFITVEETHGSNFTCVVNSAVQRKERTVEVPRMYRKGHTADCSSGRCLWSKQAEFGTKRERHGITAAFGLPFALALAIALLMAIKDTCLIPNGGAVLEEVWCVFQKQEVCVYRQGRLEVSKGYKGAVSYDTHTLPSGGIRLTLAMTKEANGHPINGMEWVNKSWWTGLACGFSTDADAV